MTAAGPARVLIVEDSATVRGYLRELIAGDPGLTLVGEAADGAHGLTLALRLEPDVVVMDLDLPGVDGVTTIRELMVRRPTPVLVFCGDPGGPAARGALEAGAMEIIGKSAPGTQGGPAAVARAIVSKLHVLRDVRPIRRRVVADVAPPERRVVRVLVVDDSMTVRACLRRAFGAARDLLVVGEAVDGAEAVEQVTRLAPDVVVMDVSMPRLDGVAATKRIMAARPTPIVLFCSRSDPQAMKRSFEALGAGALALVEKPRPGSDAGADVVLDTLLARVRSLAGAASPKAGTPVATRAQITGRPRRVELVVVASSTGGPAALVSLLDALPTDGPPICVAQHMGSGFGEGFARWLGDTIRQPVVVVTARLTPAPGHVYVAPSDRNLVVTRDGGLACESTLPTATLAPLADVLFRSAAAALGDRAVGVVLTGMGRDGAQGLAALAARGAPAFVQAPETCVVSGMPQAALDACAAAEPLSLEALAERLRQLAVR